MTHGRRRIMNGSGPVTLATMLHPVSSEADLIRTSGVHPTFPRHPAPITVRKFFGLADTRRNHSSFPLSTSSSSKFLSLFSRTSATSPLRRHCAPSKSERGKTTINPKHSNVRHEMKRHVIRGSASTHPPLTACFTPLDARTLNN